MRALIVTCVYPPEPNISGRGSADIAEELVRRGHSVSVVAPFPSRPGGRLYPGFRRRLFDRSVSPSGIEVTRCFSTLSRRASLPSRFFESLSFGVTGGLAAAAARRPDVVYANTWPVVATSILAAVARLRGVPLVMTVQDVYPESLVSQGRVGAGSLFVRALRAVDSAIARSAAAVLPISRGFADIYTRDRGVSPRRVRVVPNWLRPAPDDPVRSAEFRGASGIAPGDFVAVYGGNVGVAAGVETVLESLRLLDSSRPVHLVVAGDGSELERCRRLANDIANGRVHFISPWPTERTAEVLGAADVLLLPTRGRQSLASVPSKLIAYMLTGRPVLAMASPGSDLADTVERSGAGWLVAPDDPAAFSAALATAFDAGAAERDRRGAAGRAFALREMTAETCLPLVVDALEAVAAGREPGDGPR